MSLAGLEKPAGCLLPLPVSLGPWWLGIGELVTVSVRGETL